MLLGATPVRGQGDACGECSSTVDLGCHDADEGSGLHCLPNNTVTVNRSDTVTFSMMVQTCFGNVQAGGSFTAGLSRSFVVPPCSECWKRICYPRATVRAVRCTRYVCDEYGWRDSRSCNGPTIWGCVRGHYEEYTSCSISTGRAMVTVRCVEAGCRCRREMPQADCPCNPGAHPEWAEEDVGAEEMEDDRPFGRQKISFDVAQLADMGRTVDPAPLTGLDVLSLAQLRRLKDVLESSVSELRLPRWDLEVDLVFDGGVVEPMSYADWTLRLEALMIGRREGAARADINLDGVVDVLDVVEEVAQLDSEELGARWMSQADVDGDLALTYRDLCDVVEVVLQQLQ